MGADPRPQGPDEDAARAGAARPLPRRLAPGRRRLRAALRRLGRAERHRRLPSPRPAERRVEPPRGGRGRQRGRPGVRRRPRLQPRPARRDGDARREGAPSSRARRRAGADPRSHRLARAAPRARARRGDQGRERAPGRPLLPGRDGNRPCRGARGGAGGRRPDRLRGLPDRAHAAPRVRRDARRSRSRGLGSTAASTSTRSGGPPISSTSTSATSRSRRFSPRVATRAAQRNLPPGLVAALDVHLRAHGAGDRLDEVLDELERIRAEAGWPPLAAPIGQILASQALLHVLSASRYQTVVDELRALFDGRYGTPPVPFDPAVSRAVELVSGGAPRRSRRRTSTSSATRPQAWPRARRSCSCSRSSARRPSRCCGRSAAEGSATTRPAQASTSRERADPRDRADRPGDRRRRGRRSRRPGCA